LIFFVVCKRDSRFFGSQKRLHNEDCAEENKEARLLIDCSAGDVILPGIGTYKMSVAFQWFLWEGGWMDAYLIPNPRTQKATRQKVKV